MAALGFVISTFRKRIVQDKDHEDLPPLGSIIRAAYPLRYPVRSSVSSHASSLSLATPGYDTKHLGIVVGCHHDSKAYNITIYPILSFSSRQHIPISSRINHWKPGPRRLLLPLPHTKTTRSGSAIFQPGFRIATTPSDFGEPLDCGLWLDRRPSWLWADPETFSLKIGAEYDVPDITWNLSAAELQRVIKYAKFIDDSDLAMAVASSALGPAGRAGGTSGNEGRKGYGGSKFEPSNNNSTKAEQKQNEKYINKDGLGSKETNTKNLGTIVIINGQPVLAVSKAELDSFWDPYSDEDWEPWECVEGNELWNQSGCSDKVSNWLQSVGI